MRTHRPFASESCLGKPYQNIILSAVISPPCPYAPEHTSHGRVFPLEPLQFKPSHSNPPIQNPTHLHVPMYTSGVFRKMLALVALMEATVGTAACTLELSSIFACGRTKTALVAADDGGSLCLLFTHDQGCRSATSDPHTISSISRTWLSQAGCPQGTQRTQQSPW